MYNFSFVSKKRFAPESPDSYRDRDRLCVGLKLSNNPSLLYFQFYYLEILTTRGRPTHRKCYTDPCRQFSSYWRSVKTPKELTPRRQFPLNCRLVEDPKKLKPEGSHSCCCINNASEHKRFH
jgi:hypothetical protein